jgi:chromosome segregation ATPase
MFRILERLKAWGTAAPLRAKLSSVRSDLARLESERDESDLRLKQRAAELSALSERIQRDVEEARGVHRRLEYALEEIREQNRVLETTINTLVASHKLVLERVDADTAIQVRSRVAASVAMRE